MTLNINEEKSQFVSSICLIIIVIILLVFLAEKFNEPLKYSIDSLRNSNCEDLHSTYSECIRKSSSICWDYCNTLILPFYQKCV